MALAVVLVIVLVLLAALAVLWLVGERGHLILPSTLHALRSSGSGPRDAALRHRTGWLDVIHAYAYGRWTNQYIALVVNWLMPRMSPAARDRWATSYHGKVLTHDLAAGLVMLDHDVCAPSVEHIVPYPVARDIVLHSPLTFNLYECACRHARPNGGCQPSDVCLTIGGPDPDFLLDHNPYSARRISREQALEVLRAEHARGHLHSAWFKDVLGGRLFAICNCCKCCCGGIEAMVKYGARAMVSSGYVAAVDETTCAACGVCVDACPFSAITLDGTKAEVDAARCMGCGVCASQCACDAIALVRDETKPAPLDVSALH